MKKKKIAALCLIAGIMGALAGCGNKEMTAADIRDMKVEEYVTLPDYKALNIYVDEKPEVTDMDVELYIRSRADELEEMHQYSGKVASGDVVNIDYAGTIDGTAFEGGTSQDYLLEIGSGSFIPGFEDGLVGKDVGETVDLSLQFPANYRNAEVAGKECIFAVKINYILVPLSDENVNMLDADYTSVEAYRTDVEKLLVDYVDYQYNTEMKNGVAIELLQGCTFEELPESLVADYRADLKADFEETAAENGLTLEEYMLQAYNVTADRVEESLDSIALQCAQEAVALQAIANQEGIDISDEELDEEIQTATEQAGYTTPEELLGEEYDKESIRISLLNNKVYDFLIEENG